ncbi:MAG TPA: glycosyltransferase family 9 protein [Candidatus Competibacteraceae bacterium]|nr:glycosyltransferase family 9 protein [Candidatus Competibacteraceae bacterium]MCP5132168.1 glycosyltransferase family 9 protein [Gammaproteobacteria bacterium]HPF58093.1 glycosyltransferase family 9 protein [Candidatus Competibacteraceae bacterium]HRY19502.1 glycosyltransferase family 9 protein [Candidatus Competibacteraceae bacterium]
MRQILVVTLSNLGDVIMTTPVIMALATQFPSAKLTVLAGPKASALLEKSPHIHRVVVYDKKASWREKGRLLRELRKDRYDYAVDLRNTPIPWLLRCDEHSPLFRHFRKTNMRERHWEILEMMGFDFPNPPVFQFFDEVNERTALEKLQARGIPGTNGWIVVAPGAASEKKRWPVESFQAVLSALAARTTRAIVLVGAPDERPITEAVARGLSGTAAILCGETTINETAALLSKAALVLANDSAIMHLGFELGAPAVGIFGPTDHEKYGHAGQRFRIAFADASTCSCNTRQLPYHERSCFHGLQTEKVLQLCWELLDGQ